MGRICFEAGLSSFLVALVLLSSLLLLLTAASVVGIVKEGVIPTLTASTGNPARTATACAAITLKINMGIVHRWTRYPRGGGVSFPEGGGVSIFITRGGTH